MKFSIINTACDAVYKFEIAENRSVIYRALDALAHKDFQQYRTVLLEFANSKRTQEDYDRLRVAVVGAPLPPKPTATEILANCLNGQYGRGTQLAAERLKNNGPSRDLMMQSLITLMKPYGFVMSEQEVDEAIKQL